MDLGLQGKAAIVTGGSKGIGRAIAFALAGEDVSVAICARGEDDLTAAAKEIEQQGGSVLPVVVDVTNPDDIDRLVDETLSEFERLDILVNNAGKAQPGSFDSLTDENWFSDYEMKAMSMIRCSRAALPHLESSGDGRIINVNAIIGRQSNPGFMSSIVNRAASLAFTKALSDELAPAGKILVNSVNIGFVETPQWENVWQRLGADKPKGEFFQQMAEKYVPLGRFGEPEEVAGLVVFLASKQASYITGASIDVGGGMGRYI